MKKIFILMLCQALLAPVSALAVTATLECTTCTDENKSCECNFPTTFSLKGLPAWMCSGFEASLNQAACELLVISNQVQICASCPAYSQASSVSVTQGNGNIYQVGPIPNLTSCSAHQVGVFFKNPTTSRQDVANPTVHCNPW